MKAFVSNAQKGKFLLVILSLISSFLPVMYLYELPL